MWQVSAKAQPNTWREQETGDVLFRVACHDSASRHCPHDAHTLMATRVLTCAHDEHTQQQVGPVWRSRGWQIVDRTGKAQSRKALREYRIGSTIFAATAPTESRTKPPATGTPAAASAEREAAHRGVRRDFTVVSSCGPGGALHTKARSSRRPPVGLPPVLCF